MKPAPLVDTHHEEIADVAAPLASALYGTDITDDDAKHAVRPLAGHGRLYVIVRGHGRQAAQHFRRAA